MSSIPRCEAASISTTSSEVPAAIAVQAWQVPSGSGVGPCAQLSAFARMRASDVFPVPRGPAKRYAWRTLPAEIAFLSVRTLGSCPTTSSKPWGRYLRYSAVKNGLNRFNQKAPHSTVPASARSGSGSSGSKGSLHERDHVIAWRPGRRDDDELAARDAPRLPRRDGSDVHRA